MSSINWEQIFLRIDELQLQNLLTEVFRNSGWEVKNMHRIDPKSESGADLELRKGSDKILIAVKYKPRTSDVKQLNRLWERREEGRIIYAHSLPSTGGFAKEADKLRGDIEFLNGDKLHTFLVEGESIEYVKLIFELHPLVREYSDALAIVWSCKDTEILKRATMRDLHNVYSLKQALLKKRGPVSVFSLKYDQSVNKPFPKEPKNFPKMLDEVLGNLDLSQRFAGISLFEAFNDVSNTTPHLLALLWNQVSQRSFWKDYTHATKHMKSVVDVAAFTSKYWVLPNDKSVGEAKLLNGNAIGFLSGVSDILKSLSRSLRDLEVAVDSIWSDATDWYSEEN